MRGTGTNGAKTEERAGGKHGASVTQVTGAS